MSEIPTYEALEKRIEALETAAEKLKETKRELDQILSMSLDMICMADIHTATFTKVNQAFTETLGYEEKDLLGRPFLEFIHPGDIDATREVVEDKLLKGEKVFNFENRYRCRDGGYRWLSWTSHPDPENGITYAVARDITQMKKAEEDLRQSEQRVRKKLDAVLSPESDLEILDLSDIIDAHAIQTMMDDFYSLTKIGVGIIDLNGKVLIATGWQDICTFFHREHPETMEKCIESDLELSNGIEPGTFRAYRCKNNMWEIATPVFVGGKHLGNLFLGQFFYDDELPNNEIFRAQARKYGFDESAYMEALNRVPRWSRETVRKVMDFYVRFTSLISKLSYGNLKLAQELHARKSAEQALKESEERFRILSKGTVEGIVIHDNGKVLQANSQYYEMFGFTAEELAGKNALRLTVTEESLKIIENKISREYLGPYEVIGRKKNGSEFPIEIRAQPIEMEGCIKRMVAIRDLSDRKRLEAQLQQAQKMESIGNLAGGIAHDFNNILFPITGLSELLLEDLPSDSLEYENVQRILKASERGSDLVQQILAFSRQSEHKMMPIRLQQILEEALKLSRSTIPANIEIHQDIQVDCGLVMGDATHIHQIAMNLITNAYHAIEAAGGKISVRLKEAKYESGNAPGVSLKAGRYAMMSFEDTGSGIHPEHIEKIFEPYFTTKEQGKGTGLGLAVAYGIIKEHGGDISVRSELGKGSVFHVFLPLMEEAAGSEPLKRPEPLPTGRETILLIDDEELIIELESQILKRLGYDVIAFTRAEDALEAFKAGPHDFDLVITDMAMPRMTGDHFARELFSVRPDIPVIICTGFSERMNEYEAKRLGITGLLRKPISNSDMAKMVRRVLDDTEIKLEG